VRTTHWPKEVVAKPIEKLWRVAMDQYCTESTRSELAADILERIPISDEEAVLLHKLCPRAIKDELACTNCILGMLTILHVFDAIVIIHAGIDGETRVKARSQTASYFLRSLATYIRHGLPIVSDWQREGVGIESLTRPFVSGAQLVYLMEHTRTVEYGDLAPIRRELIAKVIIKARIRGRREPAYLVQYDDKAQQFQIIGGRKRSTDVDMLTVVKREIEEELRQNHLMYPRDYELQELASDLKSNQLSPTYGAYTEYCLTTYQALIRLPQLDLGPNDRWATLSELLDCATKDGERIFEPYIRDLDRQLPGGLKGLPLSIDEVQGRPLSEILKERRWHLIELAFAIIGIILSILFFLWER
jgi:hypothetical protein